MNRSDLVTLALQGDFGKPRPALVIQSDMFNATHATATVLLLSSEIVDSPLLRITLAPNPENGLKKTSQIQVDKAMTVRRERIGPAFGRLDSETMVVVNRDLAVFLGFA